MMYKSNKTLEGVHTHASIFDCEFYSSNVVGFCFGAENLIRDG